MGQFSLVRIDFRLIHGQVITKWLKHAGAEKIVIIDDQLSKDEFMKSIYVMAAPPGIVVEVYSKEEAVQEWNSNQLGDKKILLLFKDVKTTYDTIKMGLPLEHIQIGGLGAGAGKKKVYGPIALSDEDFRLLNELDQDNVTVVLHQVPDESPMSFEKVKQKF